MRGLILSLGAALLLTGCVVVDDQLPNDQLSRWPILQGGGPPPWAPAHGHRAKHAKHAYLFFPSVGVYVNVNAGTYFYMSGGSWTVAAQLPPTIVLGSHDFVRLELATDKPYLYYDDHKVKFKAQKVKGRGKGYEKRQAKGRGKGRGRPF